MSPETILNYLGRSNKGFIMYTITVYHADGALEVGKVETLSCAHDFVTAKATDWRKKNWLPAMFTIRTSDRLVSTRTFYAT